MANGRMNFDQFEDDEMDYIPKEFGRGGTKEDKKKVLKMKKDFKEKSKNRVVNDKKRFNELILEEE
ncbi:MAG: hypothetical protein ACRC7F_03215 [Cetobacterium sp.]|uniref:hypothetical protein n=1 Tax=unclassified Cetobacterium TaxID=2630983 RepID=UPI000649200D|nr:MULTISPECIES: hypothetical protein [unclassified Cetobacterium]